MRIHRPTARRRPPPASDYFFNYFTLGLDVLFDARTHRVKKFVLHTNYPGHYNFNMYHRCEFELNVQPDKCESSVVESRGPVSITAYSKWESVSRALRVCDVKQLHSVDYSVPDRGDPTALHCELDRVTPAVSDRSQDSVQVFI
ncbi:unnamed protein product [Leptidea sinapis]|uniref:Uncharacterized protein n=1 Tax=Leptidea sinapis TaxID=189913 RepID=A0A5E4QXP7_9NEOP|nr:unnamed protein product [Leptidea sinapis]